LLKNGLVVRINKKQKLAVAIEKLELLEAVQFKTEIVEEQGKEIRTGCLTIEFKNQEAIVFDVGAAEYDGVIQFFKKKPFGGILSYSEGI
jgi:hypothetical protein